jgi:CDP-diacylglycerol--glycerol-3-phosphate 3-phosphatidyltransferase
MKRHIPNILTIARLALTVVMLACLVLFSHLLGEREGYGILQGLTGLAFASFVVAAVTDFFDGWLARRWQVTSMMGVILDPIADKVLVCGAILGLLGLGMPGVLVPGAIILFREFAVSALREVLAPRGVKLPVTFLAKTKTALQLLALGAFLGLLYASSWPGGTRPRSVWRLASRLPDSALARRSGYRLDGDRIRHGGPQGFGLHPNAVIPGVVPGMTIRRADSP